MKMTKRLVATALSILLTVLLVAWSVLAIFSSATTINQLIVASGSYELIATQTRTAMSSSATIPEQYRAAIAPAFEKSLTGKQVETIIKPLLVDIVGWLNQPTNTPAPQLVVSLDPFKSSLEAELAQGQLSEIEKAALVAQVSKQIPDQLDLTQMQNMASQQGVEAPGATVESTKQVTAVLQMVKVGFNVCQAFAFYGLLLLIVLLALLIYLGRQDGRAMLRRPAWVFISAGIVVSLTWLVAYGVPLNQTQPELTIIIKIARGIVAVVVWYGLGSLLFGIGLYGLSFLIKKTNTISNVPPIAPPPTTPITILQNPPDSVGSANTSSPTKPNP